MRQKIQSPKMTVDFVSSLRNLPDSEFKKLKKLIKASLVVCEDFLWGKKSHQLNLRVLKISHLELSLLYCASHKMKRINCEYRNKNKSTDVLSFPVHESLRKNERENNLLKNLDPLLLGDIIICRNVLIAQAKEFQISWEKEFLHLFMHGFLHLCGFDHERSMIEEKLMFSLEEILVNQAGK